MLYFKFCFIVITEMNNQKTVKITAGSMDEAALHEGVLPQVAHRRPDQSQEWHSNYRSFLGFVAVPH